jgi:hypothetical protein
MIQQDILVALEDPQGRVLEARGEPIRAHQRIRVRVALAVDRFVGVARPPLHRVRRRARHGVARRLM